MAKTGKKPGYKGKPMTEEQKQKKSQEQTAYKEWSNSIKRLMKSFGVPEALQDQIVTETKEEQKPQDTNQTLYDKAWKKFKRKFLDVDPQMNKRPVTPKVRTA